MSNKTNKHAISQPSWIYLFQALLVPLALLLLFLYPTPIINPSLIHLLLNTTLSYKIAL